MWAKQPANSDLGSPMNRADALAVRRLFVRCPGSRPKSRISESTKVVSRADGKLMALSRPRKLAYFGVWEDGQISGGKRFWGSRTRVFRLQAPNTIFSVLLRSQPQT